MSNKHESYFYRTLYAIVLVQPNGGQQWNVFLDEGKARKDAEELINAIENSEIKRYEVYLSNLEYSTRKNRIMSDEIITDESELLYES